MQAMPEVSPWPKRLLIIGVGLTVIGLTLLVFQNDEMSKLSDPRESADHSVIIGETGAVTLEPGCWVIEVEGAAEDVVIELKRVDGASTTEVIEERCKPNYEALAADGSSFTNVGKWSIDEEIEVQVSPAEECLDCIGITVYLTNDANWVSSFMSNPTLMVMFGTCGLGFLLIPLGGMLIIINRRQTAKTHLVTNQHILEAMTPDGEDQPVQTASPDILTTDQVYRLMKGEDPTTLVEREPPSPFSNVDTRTKPIPSSSTGGSGNVASEFTLDNLPVDHSWKKWDES
jgi:uncharacterized membrane protein